LVALEKHWWHWRNYTKEPDHTLSVQGNTTSQERHTLWTDLIQTNFKWNKVVILEPEETTTSYHIGFKNDYEKKCELCSIILKGPVALLLGPHQTEFFAVSQEGTPLRLKKISYSDKHSLRKTIPLI